jgi:nucleoside-diphosphate-sugar epimerase
MGARILTPELANTPNILVTGGTGFYGRSLVRRLAATGRPVRLLCRGDSHLQHSGVSLYRGDVTNVDDVRAAMRGCDTVFHCAAEKNDAERMRSVNVTGTRLLFDVANEQGVNCFCHLSSVGVIGRTRLTVVDEISACDPMNLYEETKLAAEEIVRRGMDGGRVVVLRPTNIFGAETLESLLNDSIRQKWVRFLKGNESAHLVYVEDVSAAAAYCWENASNVPVETYIVSSDEEGGVTHSEIQAALVSAVKSAPKPFGIAAPRIIPYLARLIRSGKANFGDVIYSSRKLRASGFRFPFGLRTGLQHAASLTGDPLAAR